MAAPRTPRAGSSGWAEESLPHKPKEYSARRLSDQDTGPSGNVQSLGGHGFSPLPPETMCAELAANLVHLKRGPTHGYADSSKGSPQVNWGQHWPSSRATGTGTKPGSRQVGWGQNFLRQVSVASLQMQSWQSMLMVWPGYGEMTHEHDLRVSCSSQGQL